MDYKTFKTRCEDYAASIGTWVKTKRNAADWFEATFGINYFSGDGCEVTFRDNDFSIESHYCLSYRSTLDEALALVPEVLKIEAERRSYQILHGRG